MNVAAIPSPTVNAWQVGPVAIRAYALCIIVGVIVAVWIAERRWVERGGKPGTATDIAVWAVPFGLVGARLYHLATDPELYFESGRDPIDAFKIWDGGLGIWGAVLLGAIGAWIGLRRRGASFAAFADAAAPGIAVAQAIGRIGNWFNNELYGRATSLPWGLTVHNIDSDTHKSVGTLPGHYQPTFLYELIWDLGVAGVVVWADRRFRLGGGRAFALYVMAYTVGRAWIEYLRVDHANHFGGLRLNDWTCIVVFLAALAYFVLKRGASRPEPSTVDDAGPAEAGAVHEGDAPDDAADEPADVPSGSSSTPTEAD